MLLDGAVGTELARHGFDLRAPRWSAAAIDDAPALLSEIHRSYIDAGADVITTATTCAHPWFVGDRSRSIVARAVGIAREAVSNAAQPRTILVAGSLAMLPASVDVATRVREYAATAKVLSEAGVDLLLFETFTSTDELARAVEAAGPSELPRWLAIVPREDGACLRGDDPCGALRLAAAAVLVHCCTMGAASAALGRLRAEAPSARLGAYPARGADVPDSIFARDLQALAGRAALTILGACCGSTAATIAALRRRTGETPAVV